MIKVVLVDSFCESGGDGCWAPGLKMFSGKKTLEAFIINVYHGSIDLSIDLSLIYQGWWDHTWDIIPTAGSPRGHKYGRAWDRTSAFVTWRTVKGMEEIQSGEERSQEET